MNKLVGCVADTPALPLFKKAACLSAKGLCSHLAFSQPNRTASRRAVDTESRLGRGVQLREIVHS